ncbi:MAG TPA: hypothetical protein VFY29_08125 [Terriglobia bacterium]|nr:hypothetical protein [Terriglobia bacterium]
MINYEYRLDGTIASVTYPSGKIVRYDVDEAGRVIKVRGDDGVSPEWNYADMTQATAPYTADGRLRQMKLGNGLWETRSYKSPEQPTVLQLGTAAGNGVAGTFGNGDQVQLEFTYANGNLIGQVTRRVNASQVWTQTYSYDGVNRLKTVSETYGQAVGWWQQFDYDQFGNRWVTADGLADMADLYEPSSAADFDQSNNRLTGDINSPAVYDAAGNLIQAPYEPLQLIEQIKKNPPK